MSLIDDYLIPFYGLKEGKYDYEFEAGNKFFEFFENPEIHGGDIKIDLQLYRKTNFLELKFKIKGTLNVTCDRCLEEFNHEIESENELYIRFGEDFEEISDTIIIIPREETRINVAQYIYEFSVLALPLQKIHPDKEDGKPGCNTEMLDKLNKMAPHEEEQDTDPRWDALKNLRSKN